MAGKCLYFVEGPCEKQLISALKESPGKLIPGKIKVFNIIQRLIPRSQLLSIQQGTVVALVFDTDVPNAEILKKNIELLGRYCGKVKIICLAQVLNLEDELVRCTDVREIQELTQSRGVRNFKADFCRMKPVDSRNLLERHHINVGELWETAAPETFGFLNRNAKQIKV